MVIRKHPYRKLERSIGYSFRKRKLLETALIHRSFRFETEGVDSDNQRLEFLGDAVLGFVAGAFVFKRFASKQEGFLTSLRSQIISGKALAEIAAKLKLGEYLQVGKGEAKSGGRCRPSTLADALEAVIGAAYLDGGMKAAEKIFRKVFIPEAEDLGEDVWAGNPKGRFQKVAQKKWRKAPEYRVVGREGQPHARVFTVEVVVDDRVMARGSGNSKQNAESVAAANALKKVKGI